MLNRRIFAVAVAGALSAGAAMAQSTVAVQHAKGTTEVPAAPKRVVVYDLASLDTMQGPTGSSGTQTVPNSGQSLGCILPRMISPQRQAVSTSGSRKHRPKRTSASKRANSSRMP